MNTPLESLEFYHKTVVQLERSLLVHGKMVYKKYLQVSFSQVVKDSVFACDKLKRGSLPEHSETVVICSLQQVALVAELFH